MLVILFLERLGFLLNSESIYFLLKFWSLHRLNSAETLTRAVETWLLDGLLANVEIAKLYICSRVLGWKAPI